MKRVEFNNRDITVVGNLYVPEEFHESKQYPAIVICHPAGGVKEQTAGYGATRPILQAYPLKKA